MSTEAPTQNKNNSSASKATTIVAYLALAVGLGLGLYALFAALGVWFGMWNFQDGFAMLRRVNASANWIAWATLAATLFVFITGRRIGKPGTVKLTAFAAVGVIASTLAYVVPETYRPADGTPAIHDIATDTNNPLPFVAIAPLRADAPNPMEYGYSPRMTPQEHALAQLEAYPDIIPQTFNEPKSVVFDRALAAVEQLGWELVDQDLAQGRIEATDTTFWFRFKDDVVIQIDETAEGSVLNARSLSRVGVSDVGKNAARLREFFALL
ncbi:MAG: DUF1499 domain-containing protein [Pseudohongiellaceae bacterium]|nr:DUF1499 domain-containing protein [Pseudohongiellaceae bacterium]